MRDMTDRERAMGRILGFSDEEYRPIWQSARAERVRKRLERHRYVHHSLRAAIERAETDLHAKLGLGDDVRVEFDTRPR